MVGEVPLSDWSTRSSASLGAGEIVVDWIDGFSLVLSGRLASFPVDDGKLELVASEFSVSSVLALTDSVVVGDCFVVSIVASGVEDDGTMTVVGSLGCVSLELACSDISVVVVDGEFELAG